MFPTQITATNPDEFSRCDERTQKMDPVNSLSPVQKTDASIKESVRRAFWRDDVLRAIEYAEIDVHVKDGIVYLNGHIVNTTSQSRILKAMRAIPGILGIKNDLVLDDKLTLEVAAALGSLEHTYGCKFFTGASHGMISLNGIVSDENVKLLAEQSVANHPNVRGVINNVHVSGSSLAAQADPFLQPAIGEIIYFLDGISGVVKQVVINPNNRRVVAMTVLAQFANQEQELKSTKDGASRSPERLVVLSMELVRYLTSDSGFLHISSQERNRYPDFDATRFFKPKDDWKAPHPYCPDDVLFPVEQRGLDDQVLAQLRPSPVTTRLKEQLLANDSLGGSR